MQLLVVSTSREAGLDLGLEVRADEVEERRSTSERETDADEKETKQSRVLHVTKEWSGAGEPVDRGLRKFL